MPKRTAFLVQRAAWDHTNWGMIIAHVADSYVSQGWSGEFGYDNDHLGPRAVPVALFPGRAAAEHAANQLETDAREGRNPFHFGFDYDAVTGLLSGELARRVASLGLTPPLRPPGDEEYGEKTMVWTSWWNEHCPNWTREQHAAVWELFDRVRFYEVTEIELED